MTNRKRVRLSALAAAIAAFLAALDETHVLQAQAEGIPPPASRTFCGSSHVMVNLISGVRGSGIDPRGNFVHESLSIRHAPWMLLVVTGPGIAFTTINEFDRSQVCLTTEEGTIMLADASSVPGDIVAAIDAVLEYRRSVPWPTTRPAHPSDLSTTVYEEVRGPYVYVSFFDAPDLKGPIDSCLGQEFYRVDPGSFKVWPYRGCLVGGSTIPLPPIDKLPD